MLNRAGKLALFTLLGVVGFLWPSGTSLLYADTVNEWEEMNLRDDQLTPGWLDFTAEVLPESPLPNPSANLQDSLNAYLSIELDTQLDVLYGLKFSQVGLKMTAAGLAWFVYAEPGVTCLLGDPGTPDSNGVIRRCDGLAGQFVQLDQYHRLELVNYGQGFWIARLYEWDGTPHDLAHINDSTQISYATTVALEEAAIAPNPHVQGLFKLRDPNYMEWGTGFQPWWSSDPTDYESKDVHGVSDKQNILVSLMQPGVCPDYYAVWPKHLSNNRQWTAGSVNRLGMHPQECRMFPSFSVPAVHHWNLDLASRTPGASLGVRSGTHLVVPDSAIQVPDAPEYLQEAFRFDSYDDALFESGGLSPTPDPYKFSLSFWLRLDDYADGRYKHPLGLGDIHNATFYTVPWGTTFRYKWKFGDRHDDWNITTLTPGAWTHITVTYDEWSSNPWNFLWFVDGGFMGSAQHSGGIQFGSDHIQVGISDLPLWGDYWPGAVDDIRIFDYPLTWAGVRGLYEGGTLP